ncbi:methionyl-tRNA formyltransferase [Patescibacteria group bacterium]|nr:methionyl-tRNA formyltransferase [Patescibacteria group bacterium]
MNQSKPILFFGNERLATGVTTNLPILKALVSNGYNIAAIIVPGRSSATNPSRRSRPLEVVQFAKDNNITLIELVDFQSAVSQLANFKTELAVLAAFGKLVPETIINLFPKGIINIHPSLLPRHRGPIPIEATILGGDRETGVSLMRLDKAMDAGLLYDQTSMSLSGHESKQALADNLGALGAKRLVTVLPDIISGKISPVPQAGAGISYDQRLHPSDGQLDFLKPAAQLEGEIRAFLGWPRSRTQINKLPVVITSAHVIKSLNPAYPPGHFYTNGRFLAVATSKEALIIDRLIPAGSKEMSGSDFLAGHSI